MVQADCVERPWIFLLGPTASGKSELALRLAKYWKTDINSCDSMQIYRGMDIGTAKPTLEERKRVTHHMVDVAEVGEDFSVFDYVRMAEGVCRKTEGDGKLCLFAGGTGLYANSLLFGYNFSAAPKSDAVREKLQQEAMRNGPEALHNRLAEVDPKSAEEIHPNNVKRVIRALEIYEVSGRPKSASAKRSQVPKHSYLAFCLTRAQSELWRRIDERVDRMLEAGLVSEVQKLLQNGYSRSLSALQAIGYKEIAAYLCGEDTLAHAVETIKMNTRHYAKRQMTWFKKMPGIQWINLSETQDALQQIVNAVSVRL